LFIAVIPVTCGERVELKLVSSSRNQPEKLDYGLFRYVVRPSPATAVSPLRITMTEQGAGFGKGGPE
jgi:hypothetical protein